jgi:hypothetical protein
MTAESSLRSVLHWATHHLPGFPAHVERPAGHQGTAAHGRGAVPRRWNHSPDRPPRFMAAWQRRIAAFVGRER